MFRQMFYHLIVLSLLLAPVWSAADPATRGPEAFLPESLFEFGAVVEGVPILYDFILHNRGDEDLNILDIKTG